jgi:hypothetical protein
MKKLLYLLLIPVLVISCSENPEQVLAGDWITTHQEFIKTDQITRMDAQPTGEGIIPEADIWQFAKNKTVIFYKEGKVVGTGHWKLKGRGHVVQIEYPNGLYSKYQLKKLTDDKLVILVDMKKEVRGIAKIEFEKVIKG